MTSTYLQLTNRVLQSFNEVQLTSSNFSTTTDGFALEIKEAVNQAIFDVYTEEDIKWPFAWAKATFNCVVGQVEYTPTSGATSIGWSSFRIIGNGTDYNSSKLQEVDYQVYKDRYQAGDEDLTTDEYDVPTKVIRSPGNTILLSTVPDDDYQIQYEYWAMPTALSAHSDTTTIPTEFDQVIVDKALHYGYMFRDNVEQANLAQGRYENNVNKMRRILIPQFTRIVNLY